MFLSLFAAVVTAVATAAEPEVGSEVVYTTTMVPLAASKTPAW